MHFKTSIVNIKVHICNYKYKHNLHCTHYIDFKVYDHLVDSQKEIIIPKYQIYM